MGMSYRLASNDIKIRYSHITTDNSDLAAITLMGRFTVNSMHFFKHSKLCKARLDTIKTVQRTGLRRKGEEHIFLCRLF